MAKAKVSKKGWVVIPKEIRERHSIRPGDELVFVDYGAGITIFPALKDPIAAGRGLLKGGKSMKEFLEEKRRELEEEEAGLPPPLSGQ
jgi:AbrB family looped-hinge helix DNA binding protein